MAFEQESPARRGAVLETRMPDYVQNYLIFELADMETNILLEDNYTDIKLDLNVHSVQIEEGAIDTLKLGTLRPDKESGLQPRNPATQDAIRSRGQSSRFGDTAVQKHEIFSKIMSSPLDLEHDDSDYSYR